MRKGLAQESDKLAVERNALEVESALKDERIAALERENTRLSGEVDHLRNVLHDAAGDHDALTAENTRLKEKLDAADSIPDRLALETLLECISDVATGRRPPEDFMPAEGVLAEVIALVVPVVALGVASDNPALRKPCLDCEAARAPNGPGPCPVHQRLSGPTQVTVSDKWSTGVPR